METIPNIELDRTYYIYEGDVYKYREDIEEKEAETYAGLDDEMINYTDGLEIEELTGVELLERIGDENICLTW